ncbi:DUF3037 domain-containing protein [Hymenobacter sp. NST-14]|uniref:DUF3037 domain-containing protein n=1 Tax=Hymenobacter piscis TaxID=2839984 RepID=UPI001C021D0B|nr:DUF3037 domain-containing protein [Hymenobacter piscis]MBT9394802.1 DUF3037 domain-containing protein [Hymenobacter piscis]
MKTYQYQVLRYLHDHVTGEFVNVGLVFYEPQTRFLRAQVISKAQRLTDFFPGLVGRHILAVLKHFAAAVNRKGQALATQEQATLFAQGNEAFDLRQFTLTLVRQNDAAWQLTAVEQGLTLNPDRTFADLYQRLIGEYQQETPPPRTADEQVWRQSYKRYFDRHHLTEKLEPRQIPTANDEIKFEHTWQNGVLNCFEAVTFQLKQPAKIKDKAYKWVGRLTELGTGDVPLHVYLLTASPNDPALQETIEQIITAASSPMVQVDIIHENEAENFARQIERKMQTAGHE